MTTIWFLRYALELVEPGGVTIPAIDAPAPPSEPGNSDADHEPDAVIDTDTDGRPYLPGTSLAGVWRSRLIATAGLAAGRALFGNVGGPGSRTDGSVDADPSRVWVMHATLDDSHVAPGGSDQPGTDQPDPLRRTLFTTAIDRRTGAARTSTLRGVELLRTGTTFHGLLRITDPTDTEKDLIKSALTGWSPLIGRGTATGHGRTRFSYAAESTLDLSSRADLVTWLTGGGSGMVEKLPATPIELSDEVIADGNQCVRLTLTLTGPLLITGRRSTKAEDLRIVTTALLDDNGQPILPAASLKGVLRSRVEYILRTVGIGACPDQCCGTCRPCAWFGFGGGHDDTTTVGQRARIRFFTAIIDNAVIRRRAHSPLDRFTGGAARRTRTDAVVHKPGKRGGLLHTVEAPEAGVAVVTILLDERLTEPELCKALLRLALDDLDEGLIGIGAGTTRGYGNVAVTLDQANGLPDLSTGRTVLAAAAAAASSEGTNT